MDVQLRVDGKGKLEAYIRTLQPGYRAKLHQVGANALSDHVRRHLRSVAPSRHATADRLGGKRTMHIENAIGSVVPHADASHGEVVIPIAGIGRAFHNINLTTPTRNGKKYLTVPCDAESYGHTVDWMRERGWKIFRPGKAKILLGYKRKGDKPRKLFALSEGHTLKQDPSLLPTQAEASSIVVRSIATECKRIIRNAH